MHEYTACTDVYPPPFRIDVEPHHETRGIQVTSECGRYWRQAERAPPLGAAIDVGVSLPWKCAFCSATEDPSFEIFATNEMFEIGSTILIGPNVIYGYSFFFFFSNWPTTSYSRVIVLAPFPFRGERCSLEVISLVSCELDFEKFIIDNRMTDDSYWDTIKQIFLSSVY